MFTSIHRKILSKTESWFRPYTGYMYSAILKPLADKVNFNTNNKTPKGYLENVRQNTVLRRINDHSARMKAPNWFINPNNAFTKTQISLCNEPENESNNKTRTSETSVIDKKSCITNIKIYYNSLQQRLLKKFLIFNTPSILAVVILFALCIFLYIRYYFKHQESKNPVALYITIALTIFLISLVSIVNTLLFIEKLIYEIEPESLYVNLANNKKSRYSENINKFLNLYLIKMFLAIYAPPIMLSVVWLAMEIYKTTNNNIQKDFLILGLSIFTVITGITISLITLFITKKYFSYYAEYHKDEIKQQLDQLLPSNDPQTSLDTKEKKETTIETEAIRKKAELLSETLETGAVLL